MKALLDAAKIAGMPVLRSETQNGTVTLPLDGPGGSGAPGGFPMNSRRGLMNEHTATALAYGIYRHEMLVSW